MLIGPPMKVTLAVYFGGKFGSGYKDYDYTGSTLLEFEDVDIRDVRMEELEAFLKEKVPYDYTDIYYFPDDYEPQSQATTLHTDDQWDEIKETLMERSYRISLYLEYDGDYNADQYDTDGKFFDSE